VRGRGRGGSPRRHVRRETETAERHRARRGRREVGATPRHARGTDLVGRPGDSVAAPTTSLGNGYAAAPFPLIIDLQAQVTRPDELVDTALELAADAITTIGT
jgi:hypothetical protein